MTTRPKKYSGALGKRISAHEIKEAKSRSPKMWRFELEVETLGLLAEHYEIPKDDSRWFELCRAMARDHVKRLKHLPVAQVGRPRKLDGFLEKWIAKTIGKKKRGQPVIYDDSFYINFVQVVSSNKAKLTRAGRKTTDKAAIEEFFRDFADEHGKAFPSANYRKEIEKYRRLLPRARKRVAEIIINY